MGIAAKRLHLHRILDEMKNAQLGLYSRAIAVALLLLFTTPSLFANNSKETDSSASDGISKKEEIKAYIRHHLEDA